MSIKVGAGFDVGNSDAVDKRLVLSKNMMRFFSLDENLYKMPDVYFAICSEDGGLYLFNKNNENQQDDTEYTGRFRRQYTSQNMTMEYDEKNNEIVLNGFEQINKIGE